MDACRRERADIQDACTYRDGNARSAVDEYQWQIPAMCTGILFKAINSPPSKREQSLRCNVDMDDHIL